MPWRAAVQASIVVVVLLLLLTAQAAWNAHVRFWVRRLEREKVELSRTIAAVQGWAEQQFRAVRGELSISCGNGSTAQVVARRTQTPLASAESPPDADEDPEQQRDTVAMQAPAATGPTPSDEDGDATTFFGPDPPMYAGRVEPLRPPAPFEPLAHADLIGSEDIFDEVAPLHLGPDEKTPPRRGRAAMAIPVFRGPEEGDAA
jgi:hypothetical protein